MICFDIFLIFAQNIILGTQSNEYPQSMFWSKINEIRYTPANPSFYVKVGFKWVYFSWTCFPDGLFVWIDALRLSPDLIM